MGAEFVSYKKAAREAVSVNSRDHQRHGPAEYPAATATTAATNENAQCSFSNDAGATASTTPASTPLSTAPSSP